MTAQRVLFYLVSCALIAVLIAIATPNFVPHPAHRHSPVSRTLADMREMRTAVESYAVDNAVYPRMAWGDSFADSFPNGEPVPPDEPLRLYATLMNGIGRQQDGRVVDGGSVTTPISYITTLLPDACGAEDPLGVEAWRASRLGGHLLYWSLPQYRAMLASGAMKRPGTRFPYAPNAEQLPAFEEAFGDYVFWSVGPMGWEDVLSGNRPLFIQYDPTNGAQSAGSIFVSQKETKPVWVDALALEP